MSCRETRGCNVVEHVGLRVQGQQPGHHTVVKKQTLDWVLLMLMWFVSFFGCRLLFRQKSCWAFSVLLYALRRVLMTVHRIHMKGCDCCSDKYIELALSRNSFPLCHLLEAGRLVCTIGLINSHVRSSPSTLTPSSVV